MKSSVFAAVLCLALTGFPAAFEAGKGVANRGLQVGAVNLADSLYGVQIGFLNFNYRGVVLPVINVGW